MDQTNDADLYFDPNEVDADWVVRCWIPHGPRAGDAAFDPRTGDLVVVTDEEEPAETARVVRRDGNWVWVQLLAAPNP